MLVELHDAANDDHHNEREHLVLHRQVSPNFKRFRGAGIGRLRDCPWRSYEEHFADAEIRRQFDHDVQRSALSGALRRCP